jgi:elongation factor G
MDNDFTALIDLIKMKAYYFEGKNGEIIVEKEIPPKYLEQS